MTLLQTQQSVFTERTLLLSGRVIEAWQWTVPFYDADGQLQGLLGGWLDISECKQLERDLSLARQQAEQAKGAMGAVLSSIQQGARAPLATLIRSLEAEREDASGRDEASFARLEAAHRSALQLATLIEKCPDPEAAEASKD
jgi:two-component system sensor histidine kinase EvgS